MIVAIDVGLKRIGVAVGSCAIATPQKAILRKNRDQAAYDVDNFLVQWEARVLVVGIPVHNEETSRRIKHFVSLLKFAGEIVFIDEGMSSIEAEELIKGDIEYKRDGRIDSIAAMIILQRYFQKK